jgi:hypothetical protein
VAVNKVDKEGAQPDRVRTEMTALGLQPVEWGGDTEFVNVSAKTHEGLAIVPFGYPAAKLGAGRKKRKPISEVASRERFGTPFA